MAQRVGDDPDHEIKSLDGGLYSPSPSSLTYPRPRPKFLYTPEVAVVFVVFVDISKQLDRWGPQRSFGINFY